MGRLTKLFTPRYVPATPGVPGRPEIRHCSSLPDDSPPTPPWFPTPPVLPIGGGYSSPGSPQPPAEVGGGMCFGPWIIVDTDSAGNPLPPDQVRRYRVLVPCDD